MHFSCNKKDKNETKRKLLKSICSKLKFILVWWCTLNMAQSTKILLEAIFVEHFYFLRVLLSFILLVYFSVCLFHSLQIYTYSMQSHFRSFVTMSAEIENSHFIFFSCCNVYLYVDHMWIDCRYYIFDFISVSIIFSMFFKLNESNEKKSLERQKKGPQNRVHTYPFFNEKRRL